MATHSSSVSSVASLTSTSVPTDSSRKLDVSEGEEKPTSAPTILNRLRLRKCRTQVGYVHVQLRHNSRALCHMSGYAYYVGNYAGIMGAGLGPRDKLVMCKLLFAQNYHSNPY